jgi:hypothetical protein
MLAAIQAKRAQARLEGSNRLYQSYAQPVPIASWNMRQFFRADTIEPVRKALLITSSEYQGRLFVAGDHVHQLSLPVHVDKPDGTAALVGSINDTLDHPAIAEFPLATANQWFLSLANAPDATPGATNIFAVANSPSPDQVGPPAPAEGDAEPPSLLRLDFDRIDLRFGVFPLMPPVPCGLNIPPAHPLQHPFPEDVIETAPFLEEWCRAAAWTVRLNKGLSVNHGGPMFAPDALELQPDTFLQQHDRQQYPVGPQPSPSPPRHQALLRRPDAHRTCRRRGLGPHRSNPLGPQRHRHQRPSDEQHAGPSCHPESGNQQQQQPIPRDDPRASTHRTNAGRKGSGRSDE